MESETASSSDDDEGRGLDAVLFLAVDDEFPTALLAAAFFGAIFLYKRSVRHVVTYIRDGFTASRLHSPRSACDRSHDAMLDVHNARTAVC